MLKSIASHNLGRFDSQQINPQTDQGKLVKKNTIESKSSDKILIRYALCRTIATK